MPDNTSTITITPSSGFTGSVALTASITASPAGASDIPVLSFGSTPPVAIASSNPATGTLTISTTAPNTAALPREKPGPWHLAGAGTLACILLCGFSSMRRKWQARLGLFALLLVLLTGIFACGGGSGSSGNGSGGGATHIPGTTAGTYTITVTGKSGSLSAFGPVTLIVN